MPSPEDDAYQELYYYTLTHGAPAFILQHVVDAHAAQHANASTKPIRITFALVGLYLHVERGFTGREVQRAHMQIGARTHDWPAITLPDDRGQVTAASVLACPAGPERDRAIDGWCASLWQAYRSNEAAVVALLQRTRIL